ncbi:uncharacterized protein HMPREF1120_07400 [Exophiala dermatitidis NIH/UT8656]|uniref:Uncharacterized protein n=1 Tax=Exophiala dermatitidis (strain ATCC 34100 / CBS 525.76 / NIH/UT8656) TaxID=858893 RepID=H6C6R5_EXODN|nr:uncharacterized protein HMPREF1120_07400 [Exophiala dermatitidis NIH/UT8656]EHY59410.1 hypothetical protein HMPREF1120_07400 [Exophiala dermatitidis NIH/UT8656]
MVGFTLRFVGSDQSQTSPENQASLCLLLPTFRQHFHHSVVYPITGSMLDDGVVDWYTQGKKWCAGPRLTVARQVSGHTSLSMGLGYRRSHLEPNQYVVVWMSTRRFSHWTILWPSLDMAPVSFVLWTLHTVLSRCQSSTKAGNHDSNPGEAIVAKISIH